MGITLKKTGATVLALCVGGGIYGYFHQTSSPASGAADQSAAYTLSTNVKDRLATTQHSDWPTGDAGGTASIAPSTGANAQVGTDSQPTAGAQPTADSQPTTVTIPQNTQASSNWAGYVATPTSSTGGYSSVAGSWKVPTIRGSQDSVGAQWLGLGGVNTHDLLQMGTLEQYENGQPVAYVFWEKLPATANMVMKVPIGSTVDARIAKASTSGSTSRWHITFAAHTPSGQTLSKTIPVTLSAAYGAAIGSSAEWISEDPSDGNNQLYPLADMGTVTYSNASVDGQPLSAASNQVQPVALVSSRANNVLIAPSDLASDGRSFATYSMSSNASGYNTSVSQRRSHPHRRAAASTSGWGVDTGAGYSVGFGYAYSSYGNGGGYGGGYGGGWN